MQQMAMHTTPCPEKKRTNSILGITSSNTDRFTKFFHFYNLLKICNKAVVKYPNAPKTRRYTTLCRDVVSGTTVQALVPGRFGQNKVKTVNLKDTAKERIKICQIIKGGLMLWAADVCSRAAFAQSGPVSSISQGRFSSE